jgi:AcrR family transcriptional regulator
MRGRPRKFDEDEAMKAAIQVFWAKGLSGASLDDLASAMRMNRPSIYNAFGNKEELYRRALSRFCGQLDLGLNETLETIPTLREGLGAFYERAIDVYCATDPPMGCLMVCTAPAEALSHPEVGDDLKGLIKRLDRGFARRLKRARAEGEVSGDLPVDLTAQLLQATLQTVALRARSGAGKGELRKLAARAVARLTG